MDSQEFFMWFALIQKIEPAEEEERAQKMKNRN